MSYDISVLQKGNGNNESTYSKQAAQSSCAMFCFIDTLYTSVGIVYVIQISMYMSSLTISLFVCLRCQLLTNVYHSC